MDCRSGIVSLPLAKAVSYLPVTSLQAYRALQTMWPAEGLWKLGAWRCASCAFGQLPSPFLSSSSFRNLASTHWKSLDESWGCCLNLNEGRKNEMSFEPLEDQYARESNLLELSPCSVDEAPFLFLVQSPDPLVCRSSSSLSSSIRSKTRFFTLDMSLAVFFVTGLLNLAIGSSGLSS